MNIEDILDSLGLDLTDAEVRQGAADAIDAILSSRIDMSGVSMNGSGEIELELDPDLLQPSQKFNGPDASDAEVEDEENILDQIKHNDSEDTFDNQNTPSNDDLSSKEDHDNDEASSDEGDSETSDSTESSNTDDSKEDQEDDSASSELEDTESDINSDANEMEDSEDSEDASSSKKDNEENTGSDTGTETDDTEASEDDSDIDEDELLDTELQGNFLDKDIDSKLNARKVKRERTISAAKQALENAKKRKVNSSAIKELENAIKALEAIREAKEKKLQDLTDDEFNLLINRVFDAIDAVGDTELTFKTEQERELQAKEIKDDLAKASTQAELSAEDAAKIRAEAQAVKAREKENNKYQARAANSFKGFQDFLNSLYRAVAMQVHVNEVQDDSWSALNRRHTGTGVLVKGKKINELPDKKIPVIDFYFDCSGSWTNNDIKVGEKAVQALVDMEEKGQIKVNIFYFADTVHTDAESARYEGGTAAWNYIVQNVIATQATNVVIMTDSDMEHYWYGVSKEALRYTVPGYVWYLWKNGVNAPRLPRDLKGRGGTQQFSFNTSDY